jgi:hypothetical protein
VHVLLARDGCDVLAGRDTVSVAHAAVGSGSPDSALLLAALLTAQNGALRERLYLPRTQWTVCPHAAAGSSPRFQVRLLAFAAAPACDRFGEHAAHAL